MPKGKGRLVISSERYKFIAAIFFFLTFLAAATTAPSQLLPNVCHLRPLFSNTQFDCCVPNMDDGDPTTAGFNKFEHVLDNAVNKFYEENARVIFQK